MMGDITATVACPLDHLPVFDAKETLFERLKRSLRCRGRVFRKDVPVSKAWELHAKANNIGPNRSEERRVGKECW